MDPRLANSVTSSVAPSGSSQKVSKPVLAVLDRGSVASFAGGISTTPQQATLVSLEPGGRAIILVSNKELGVLFLGSSALKPGDRFSVQLRMLPGMIDSETANQKPENARPPNSGVMSTLSPGALSLGALSKAATIQEAVVAVSSGSISEARKQIQGAIRSGSVTGSVTMNLIEALSEFLSISVERSGLFYESHLKDVALGKRNAKQLLLEHQTLSGETQQIDEEGFAQGRTSSGPLPAFPTPERLSGFVSKQLSALYDNSFSMLINGLFAEPISLTYEKENAPSNADSADKNPPIWQVTLETKLPALGDLRFTVKDCSPGWSVSVWADGEVLPSLRHGATSLKSTLDALAVPLRSLSFHDIKASHD